MKIKKILLLSLLYQLFGSYFSLQSQITPWEALPLMQKGINLGNTLEPPYEAGWNNPPAEEYYFDLYKNTGFQTVRVPVRWDNHTEVVSPYKIDESWMQRVEQVLDWGLERDLFIVVNAHHDNWIKENYENPEYRARFDSIWAQISRKFKNKSERLIFEVLNEPHGLSKAQNDDMHARILSIIRESNPTRLVIFQGHNWGGSDELLQAAIPDDDYLIGSFHSYDPYLFGLEGQGTWGSSYDIKSLRDKFIAVKNWSNANNIPVFLGEFGAINDCEYNSRMKHYKKYVEFALEYGFIYCAWDDGGDFRIMERQQNNWNEIKNILLYSTQNSPKNPKISLFQDTTILLTWTNMQPDADSIIIERKTRLYDFKQIASLQAGTEVFYDENLFQNMYYYYRIISFRGNEKLYSHPVRIFLPTWVPKVREPFHGYPLSIPGIIEAEDFDEGGEGLSYHDGDDQNIAGAYRPDVGVDIYDVNGTAYHIGSIVPGEWLEYSVNVEKEDNYTIKAHISALQDGGSFTISIGDSVSEIMYARNTSSWLSTTEITTQMMLSQGEQIMRFSIIDDPIFNIDKFEFNLINTGISQNTSDDYFTAFQTGENMIKLKNNKHIDLLRIITMDGTIIFSEENFDGEEEISIPGNFKGIYLVHAISGTKSYVSKILLK